MRAVRPHRNLRVSRDHTSVLRYAPVEPRMVLPKRRHVVYYLPGHRSWNM